MAEKFERLSFTKDWNNSTDFPTYEENEAQVRADMQALHDEVKKFINEKLIPGIENLAVPGTGDMLTDVFDPDGMMQDIFAYARAQAAGAVGAAKNNAATAIAEYDNTQKARFDAVNSRLQTAENRFNAIPGKIKLLKEFRAAGSYTVSLPANTVAVYALAVGAGGGGAYGLAGGQTGGGIGGGGGAGGNAIFVGPVLPEKIANKTVVVGKGGTGGTGSGETVRIGGAGGSSSVFGLTAVGGAGGGGKEYEHIRTPGTQAASLSGEILGGDGGVGAYASYNQYGEAYGISSEPGKASSEMISLVLARPSAGGGGGGNRYAPSGSYGGASGFGSGGKGGDGGGSTNRNGGNGGQCCGGGGGGASASDGSGTGGNGGDGYVAIWIQSSGIEE